MLLISMAVIAASFIGLGTYLPNQIPQQHIAIVDNGGGGGYVGNSDGRFCGRGHSKC